MSSSVTRADVSSWQLREVTTNPISSSPRLRSTTAKRPDGEGGSDARTVGRGVGGKEREGREQRDRAYLLERLGEWRGADKLFKFSLPNKAGIHHPSSVDQ